VLLNSNFGDGLMLCTSTMRVWLEISNSTEYYLPTPNKVCHWLLSSLRTKRCSRSLHLTIGRTTASAHPVTQANAALSLSACCAVARCCSASCWWSQWPCQSSAVLHSFVEPGVKIDEIKIGALKMRFVCIFFHICWISAENEFLS